MTPKIAIPSFPGCNGEVDNMKTLRRCGFDCFVFRWNDSLEKLRDIDGYFFGAGFSYEDRGRSGMVAARDPLFRFMHEEAKRGKVIIGNCNGAQVLIESGLVPLGDRLRMCLAHNAIKEGDHWKSPGFLNQWVWVKRTCDRLRCAMSDWDGVLHMPIAHGEGRFTTKDPELIAELEANGQLAFKYCDAEGSLSEHAPVTPNGSMLGVAGICSPDGNVVALMPHPERTASCDPYFLSLRRWIEEKRVWKQSRALQRKDLQKFSVRERGANGTEIFIDTIITNNEERTVEQALRRVRKEVHLKQYRYVSCAGETWKDALRSLIFFNPNKERAYIRKSGVFERWNDAKKTLEKTQDPVLQGIAVLRRNEPDTGANAFGAGTQTGVVYDCRGVNEETLKISAFCEVLGNPHVSTLERLL